MMHTSKSSTFIVIALTVRVFLGPFTMPLISSLRQSSVYSLASASVATSSVYEMSCSQTSCSSATSAFRINHGSLIVANAFAFLIYSSKSV